MGISPAINVDCEMETRRSGKVRPGAGLLPTMDCGKADAVHHWAGFAGYSIKLIAKPIKVVPTASYVAI
jgi:hypothetical protein